MAKGSRGQRRNASRVFRWTPYPQTSCNSDCSENLCLNNCSKMMESKDWEDVTCSVCMECPHNAVLLLCSSHEKGCRPYMCGTSFRYSNCLDQYKKAYTKVASANADRPLVLSDGGWPIELACPLCRGQVKGWTVVEPAREHLNAKRRSCMQENCSFIGTYKELRKHMKANHPSVQPREVDPALEQKWRSLEREREHDDVISTIRSTMPGARVFGDYVIEQNNDDFDMDELPGFDVDVADRNNGLNRNLVNFFLLLHTFGPSEGELSRRLGQLDRGDHQTVDGLLFSDEDGDNIDGDNGDVSLASRLHRHHGRTLLGRSGRRRRRREGNNGES